MSVYIYCVCILKDINRWRDLDKLFGEVVRKNKAWMVKYPSIKAWM